VRGKVPILNHIFAALCAYIYLKQICFVDMINNAYQWQRELYTDVIASFIKSFIQGQPTISGCCQCVSPNMVFRIILALAAAGIAGVIPGLIQLKMQSNSILLINAGGALAVFVLIYLFAPADLNSTRTKVGDNQPNSSNRMIIDNFTEILNNEEKQRKESEKKVVELKKNYKTDGKRKQTAKTRQRLMQDVL
jgi:hypothetical protein